MTTRPQRVVVTAGASGIGLAIAQKFLAEGAQVFICDIAVPALEAALAENPGLQGAIANVGDPQSVEVFFSTALIALGYIDVLVNNAGIGGPRAKTEDIDYQDWDNCIRINLSGMFYCVKQVIPSMKSQGAGSIINISTSSAKTGLPNRLPYVASKVGVLGLSHNLARELGSFNIRCNTILPGLMDNPRGRSLVENYAKANQLSNKDAETEFLKYISLKSWIAPNEIADTAYYLASNQARHITGQEIAVDGNCEWEQ
jgi:NAD(P)-dependent dehydrogenase (short-subunit alcohol dehydrogenase family)